MVIPLDVALALVAANVIENHTDPAEVDRAADVLRSLESDASVTATLDTLGGQL
jgi:hypothetical protein